MLIQRLFDNLALTVEPFAMCEVSSGWRLRLDGLEWVTLHFVLAGEGGLMTGTNTSSRLGPSSLAVVPPLLAHALESGEVSSELTRDEALTQEGALMRLVAGPRGSGDLVVACGRVRAIYAGGLGLFDKMREPIVLDFSDSEQMRGIFERLLEEERTRAPGEQAMMAALMNQCLVLVFRRLSHTPEGRLPWLAALEDPRLAPVVDAILKEPDRPYTLDSLAGQAFMSRSLFARQFGESFGRTPMAFVRDVRLRRGAELLRSTALSVDTVARRVGYRSRSQFSRAFREYFGESPARFRVVSAS